MSDSNNGVRDVTNVSLNAAKSCLQKKRYGRGFANYLLFMKLAPERRGEIFDDFLLCMRLWTESLEKDDRLEDIFKCYDQACEVIPDSEVVMNNIGAQLFRLGYVEEAAWYMHRSIQINPNYLAAKENLENICSHLVERWHFRMLNDTNRNHAYCRAIHAAIEAGYHTVLDIGTGTGILSLMALEAGATEITACEKSKTMYQIAESVVRDHNGSGRINLLCETSTDIRVPTHLPDKVSLVVTETFDAAVFGEGIITTLKHAWRELLIPARTSGQTSRVIPAGATVYVCAIECEVIRNQSRFLYPGLHNLDKGDIEITCAVGSTEPYTTENLSRLQRGYRKLSDPTVLTHVNFNNPQEIDILDDGVDWVAKLKVIYNGKLDAIALWFDLHLDKDVTITTNPVTETCWEQAIFPMLSTNFKQGTQHNYMVKEGDVLSTNFCLHDNCLTLKSCSCNQATASSTATDTINDSISGVTYSLEQSDLKKLNNLYHNNLYLQAIEKLLSSTSHHTLVDFCGGLSPLCLQMLKGDVTHGVMIAEADKHDLVKRLAEVNQIDSEKLTLMEQADIGNLAGDFEVIICEIVEPCGILRQQILEDVALLRATCQADTGTVIPGKVTIHGLCIESEMLLADSAVIDDKRTMDFKIRKFMNDFQMTTHTDIDLSTLKHNRLSDPFILMTFDLNECLLDDQPPSFLEKSLTIKVTSVDAGQLTAVLYWFEFELAPGCRLCTLDTNLHWKQAAAMMKNHIELIQGQEISLKVNLRNSCIRINIDEESQNDS